jgi:hypothetical protein
MQKGDKVLFGRPNGEKTLGKIVKVNHKTFMVEQLEDRGTMKHHATGKKWRVSRPLCEPAEGN